MAWSRESADKKRAGRQPCRDRRPPRGRSDTMPEALSVVTICGSLRKGSYNATIARALPGLAPEGMRIAALEGVGELPLYNADIQAQGFPDRLQAMAEAIRAADGVIFVTPEYNYSVPGVLKNAIDWLSRLPKQPFAGKAVAIQSASQGVFGGARAQYHLRQTLVFVEALAMTRPEVMVGTAQTKISESGELTDAATRDFIKGQLA